MEDTLDLAARILGRHPSPALSYTELHRLVSDETTGPAPDPARLLRRMRTRPDRFRVVEPARGPWLTLDRSRRAPAEPPASHGTTAATRRTHRRYGSRVRERRPVTSCAPLVTWIVPGPSCRDEYACEPGVLNRIRTTLHHLGRSIDTESPVTLARWSIMIREEAALRSLCRREVSEAT